MTITLCDKFIGFVDILGYSALTRAAEAGKGLSFEGLEKLQQALGDERDVEHCRQYGPAICPNAPRKQRDLDFQVTQVWDSVVVSAEISPSGVMSVVHHCWKACIELLAEGVMCRGYISRGMICHDRKRVLGSGHVDTVAKEKGVSFFRQQADEQGTPFIEVDPQIVTYVAGQDDKCVREMFDRLVLHRDDLTAIFPIKRLKHSFFISAYAPFDPEKERANNNAVRQNIRGLKAKIASFVDEADPSVLRKAGHYLRALDDQLNACDRTDVFIDRMSQPFGHKMTKEWFPGLFR